MRDNIYREKYCNILMQCANYIFDKSQKYNMIIDIYETIIYKYNYEKYKEMYNDMVKYYVYCNDPDVLLKLQSTLNNLIKKMIDTNIYDKNILEKSYITIKKMISSNMDILLDEYITIIMVYVKYYFDEYKLYSLIIESYISLNKKEAAKKYFDEYIDNGIKNNINVQETVNIILLMCDNYANSKNIITYCDILNNKLDEKSKNNIMKNIYIILGNHANSHSVIHGVKYYKKAMEYGGNNVKHAIIKIYIRKGDECNENEAYEEAIKNYLKALNYGDINCYNKIANIYAEIKDYKKAIQYYEMAINVGDYNYVDKLGIMYESLDNTDKAKKNYEIAINRGDTRILDRLVNIYMDDDINKAFDTYIKYKK